MLLKTNVLFAVAIVLLLTSCHRKDTLFTNLPASDTNIEFSNTLEKRKVFGILYYLYYYNGGGVATGDVNNDGLIDIYFTANSKGNNKLYINKGNLKFEDITATAGVAGEADWCSGVTMADVNGDGYLDIYVSAVANHHGLKGKNSLFINNKNNTFTDRAAEYGLNFSGFTTQAAFFDFDHDGDLDCYILNQSHKPNENIVDTSNRRKKDQYAGDRLYRNDGSIFTDVSAASGIYQSNLGYGLGIAVADINNDGWEDIYIGNDFHENDYYYVNNGDGTFTESGVRYFDHYSRFSMGNDIADYNNDGQLDLVTVDMLPPDEKILKTYGSDENPQIYYHKLIRNGFQYQYSRNCLQRNNGNGSSFSETALLSGIPATDWSWAPLFADFDNDGNKDLFVSSGIVKRPVDLDYVRFISDLYMHQALNSTDRYDDAALEKMPDGSSHPFLFRGDGSIGFSDQSDTWGTGGLKGYYTGSSYADLDNDGDLDLVMNVVNAKAVVLRNNTSGMNYMTVACKGDKMNTAGIGAKVYLFQKEKLQYQQLMPTRGFQSSVDTRLHFGLDSSTVDSILVIWPDQRFQVIKHPSINSILQLRQEEAAGNFSQDQWFPLPNSIITTMDNPVKWRHRENDFVDFNIQYLIPHAESTRGPKMAVADVNKDGLDDFYVCGSTGQAGSLQIQQADGSFFNSDTVVFSLDAACEDVAALFFDANGDKAVDLYVACGGNEYIGADNRLQDRLYLNDGKGHFTKSIQSLPLLPQNKSCVASADIDRDGDMDLFVGVLADAISYGIPQDSYMLLNDGRGVFSLATPAVIQAGKLGMVTAAQFADINSDGYPDLFVTGEWMPVIVFMNERGKFRKTEIPGSTGLWQTVFADDVNGDGNMDLLAGNWGLNNKFWSGKNGPIRLYTGDYDRNGRSEQLISYTFKGQEFPFLSKDEVERPLPLLKKHYLLYTDYAGVPMKEVFYGWIDTIQPQMAERLGSAVCYGDGKGGFVLQDLPSQLQLAPVFSFQKITTEINNNAYLAGGNFFDVVPYEGRYDAQPLALFSSHENAISFIPQTELAKTKGQVRDIKQLQTGKGSIIIVARNNDELLFLRK